MPHEPKNGIAGAVSYSIIYQVLMKINPISRLVGASERVVACISINNMDSSAHHKTFLFLYFKDKT